MTTQPSSFRRAFASTLSLDLLARALSAVAVVLFLRALGVADFAFVVLFLAVGQVAGAAATTGVGIAHAHREAERISRERGSDPALFVNALAAGIALIGALALVALAIGVGAGIGGQRGELAAFVGLAAAFAAGHSTAQLAIFQRQAHRSWAAAGLIGIARGAALLAVAALTAAGAIGSPLPIATALAAAMVAVGALSARPAIRAAGSVRGSLASRLSLDREARWLTLYFLAAAPYAYAAILVVAVTLDSSAVASFGAAQRYYAIVIGAAPALLAVLRIRTAQADIVDSPAAQRVLLVDWIKRTAVPVAVALAAVAALAPFTIPLVDGGRYPLSITILELMLIPAFLLYVGNPARGLLMSQRRHAALALTITIGLGAIVAAAAGGRPRRRQGGGDRDRDGEHGRAARAPAARSPGDRRERACPRRPHGPRHLAVDPSPWRPSAARCLLRISLAHD